MQILPNKIIKQQIYLLQLENYRLGRFIKVAAKKIWSPLAARAKLEWTLKLRAVAVLAAAGQLLVAWYGASYGINIWWSNVIFILSVLLLSYIFWLFLALAVVMVWPFDFIIKTIIISRARAILARRLEVKIIGIAGSYGKTTMKEVVSAVLSAGHKVLATPENQNTPLGLARLILNKLDNETEILIVEMGAYRRGDIKKLCRIARPNISVLTGINESHLERFGTLDNTVAAKFEVVEEAKSDALIILNADDERVATNYEKCLGGRQVIFYSATNNKHCEYHLTNQKFFSDGSGQSAELFGPSTVGTMGIVQVPFLGNYIFGDVIAAVIIAHALNLSSAQIKTGLSKLKPVAHRLQFLPGQNGALVIDDSYNGNPAGVKEAINVLAKFTNRRKIYLTPGLVEADGQAPDIHHEIGRQLSGIADLVVLIKNSVTPFIAEGLKNNDFAPDKILWFNSAAEAHAAIPTFVRAGDVILFQNDWPENYI